VPSLFTIYWANPARDPATFSAEGWTREGEEYVFDCSLTPGMPDRFSFPCSRVRLITPDAPETS
jgi:hypothetical protein